MGTPMLTLMEMTMMIWTWENEQSLGLRLPYLFVLIVFACMLVPQPFILCD